MLQQIQSTPADSLTNAPCQLPKTLANISSLPPIQQNINTDSTPKLSTPHHSTPPPGCHVASVGPTSVLMDLSTSNNHWMDQLLINIQTLSDTFQSLSTTLSSFISSTYPQPPDDQPCIQPPIPNPWVHPTTPTLPHPIILFDITQNQEHLLPAVANQTDISPCPHIDLILLQQYPTAQTAPYATQHGSSQHLSQHLPLDHLHPPWYWYQYPLSRPVLSAYIQTTTSLAAQIHSCALSNSPYPSKILY